jgi:hypothetical protein
VVRLNPCSDASDKSARLANIKDNIASIALAAYSLVFALGVLRVHFAPDDMMNLAGYWTRGLIPTLGDCLTVWTSAYRPIGGLYYLPIYYLFGLNPLPYRILILTIVCINVQLVFRFAKLITRSWTAAVLTSLLFCAHANVTDIYCNNSSIYDVLACFFSVLALLSYVKTRSTGRPYRGVAAGTGTVLVIAALGSKEIAVITPALVLAFELLFVGAPRKVNQFGVWVKQQGLVPILWIGLGVIYTLGKLGGSQALARTEAYRLTLSWHQYLTNNTIYLASLLRNSYCSGWRLTLLVAFVSVICWRSGRPSLQWCWFFCAIVTLPISFIPTRGGPNLYLPLWALALFVSHFVVSAFHFFTRTLFGRASRQMRTIAAFMFVLGIWCSVAWPLSRSWPYRKNLLIASQQVTWNVICQLKNLHETPKHRSRILFVNDPFEGFDMLFIAELIWNDPSLDIQLSRKVPASIALQAGAYDEVFVFKDVLTKE